MPVSDELEEVLQALFCMEEERPGPFATEAVLERARVGPGALQEAMAEGLVLEAEGGLRLSEEGAGEAAGIVRRHRLAERLFHDVLRMSDEAASEDAACRFEHVVQDELAESICTLLGHPRACPHGKRIPPGACCANREKSVAAVVRRLSELQAGEWGAVAYVHTQSPARMERLASFGLVPGTDLRVHQTWPSVVIEVGETQLALDRETAEDVFVRRTGGGEVTHGRAGARAHGRWKHGRGQ